MTTAAQTWALIGIIGAFASTAMTMTIFSFQSLKGFMEAKFQAVDARFDAVDTKFDARFEAVDRRFDGVDRRLDALDRDVQALSDRVFRDRG
jgi:hypothetical protein